MDEFKKGRKLILIGFVVSLLYYTVVFGGPVFLWGSLLVFESNRSAKVKAFWILAPAILWFPTCLFLMWFAYWVQR
jgi:hypothetical protein